MATTVELRHLCLMVAAGGMVYGNRGAMLPPSVRCALYMLVAFALRRGNIGRDLMRGTPSHPQRFSPKDDRPQSAATLPHGAVERLGATIDMMKDKRGLPYPCCG